MNDLQSRKREPGRLFGAGSITWIHARSLAISLLVASLLSLFSSLVAVRLSEKYYAVAPYHYDSAAYRIAAYEFYEILQSKGFTTALAQALRGKDSLDITIRLLLAPRLLIHPYGHLSVLLPFMGLFILLTMEYAFSRTHSWICSIAIVGFLFSFPIIYSPLIYGIADYWKDNIGTWLMGSAVVAFILSRNLAHYGPSFLSGSLLGLISAQRTVIAVYAAFLFLPLLIVAAHQRIRTDSLKVASVRIGAFVTPALLVAGIVSLTQWRMLYKYYFVFGYAYSTPTQTAQFILKGFRERIDISVLVIIGICLLCLLYTPNWRQRRNEIFVASWMVLGFPLIVIMTRTHYVGFYSVWTVLLIVLLAACFSAFAESAVSRRVFASALLILAIAFSILQYTLSVVLANGHARYRAPLRCFHENLANAIVRLPEPHEVSFLHDEAREPFLNQVLFNQNISPHHMGSMRVITLISIHDSYYRLVFGDVSIERIVETVIDDLEQNPGRMVIGYCEPSALERSLSFQSDGRKVAIPVAISLNRYVMQSPHWKALKKLDSPYGSLYIYRYYAQPMTEVAKWRELSFERTLDEVPLTLCVAPGVRMYAYQSQYKAELYSGNYCQWLPSGSVGLRLTLFSEKARTVVFQARALPGPSRKDPVRTLAVTTNREALPSVRISQEQDIALKFHLKPGLNLIEFSVREPAERTTQSGGDARELMLLLESPRLISGPS
jgi:hypothetical protein